MKIVIFGFVALFSICAGAAKDPSAKDLHKMAARFAPVEMKVDLSKLSKGDRQALEKLVEVSRIMDRLFLQQYWKGNLDLQAKLEADKSELGKARLHYFEMNMGPWSQVDNGEAFIPGVPEKHPQTANFYPEDMTKAEFEKWVSGLSKEDQEKAKGFYSVVHRDTNGKLLMVPFHQEYAADLKKAAELLKSAADQTDNASLKKFLNLRADAFLSDDYYASEIAWMELDAPLDVTVGPYETYNDEIFGYKASFESFVTLRDDAETKKLEFFASRLQEVENNLPIKPEYRNPKIGALAPIRVVNQIIAGGDANHGVRTAAFNLPNDERIVNEKGSKRVMLRNVQQAKFNKTLIPIAKVVLSPAAQKNVKFDPFFTHILAHELSHGIGPHKIKVNGKDTDPRMELKDLYSAIEESKADITGLYLLQYLYDHQPGPGLKSGAQAEKELYTTYLASGFRTLRFGAKESHGKGMAMQMNYIMDKGGFTVDPKTGKFDVDFAKIKSAVQDLDHDLLTIEATGDYEGAKKLLAEKAVVTPALEKMLGKLTAIPTDIEPKFSAVTVMKH